MAIGGDGTVYVQSGFEIKKRNEYGSWSALPYSVRAIAVDPEGHLWIVNKQNEVY